MALTNYVTTLISGAIHTKGSYVQIVDPTPYASSRIHLIIDGSGSGSFRSFLIDIATGTAGSETVIVSNITVRVNTEWQSQAVVAIDVDIPTGSRLSARCQSDVTTSNIVIGWWLEDRAIASLSNPVTYGANTSISSGVVIDPGAVANTKGTYTQITASTTVRIDALAICLISSTGTAYSAYTPWKVDIATGASSLETVIIADIILTANTSAMAMRPTIVRFPISIPAGTKISARASCGSTNSTQRLISMTLIGMQQPTTSSLLAAESVQFSVVKPE